MNAYKAAPVSRKDIRKMVRMLKEKIGLEDIYYFPIVQFSENILPMFFPDFTLEIVPKNAMFDKEGETYPENYIIRIREDVYIKAIKGEGRSRFIIAHEIGHLFLHSDKSIALCRLSEALTLRPFEDPEWQADAFAGELLASSYLIRGMDADEVRRRCGVSAKAARCQLKALNRQTNKYGR